MIRVAVLGCLLGLALSAASAQSAFGQADDPELPDGAELPEDTELPDGARTIIGSPDPGPEPEGPGDRGGWAQLMTLGVLAVAVGFILWRIVRAVRAAPAAVIPPAPRRSP